METAVNKKSTVFRVEISSGSCIPNVFSETAIVSVIPSNIEPAPVKVEPAVVCKGENVTLSSSTGYGETFGKFDGGDFTSAGIKNQGWNFTDPNGNPVDYNASANSGTPNHWHKTQPKWKFTTANINSPYNTTDMWWNPLSDGKQNEHFAITQGTYSSNMDTPPFTLGGMDEGLLTFDQAYNLTTGATIRVLLLKNGVVYKELYKVTGSATSGNYEGFASGTPGVNKMKIDLGSYIGESNLRIRFEYTGVRPGDIWAVDNIKVPDGPRDVTLEWRDYSDPTNPTGVYIGNKNSEQWEPTLIGWNKFEVRTAIILDSNGANCTNVENFKTIRVFVFDRYTTTITAIAGTCGDYVVNLTANTTGLFGGEALSYPTLDGYIGEWVITKAGVLADPTTYTLVNTDSNSHLKS